MSNKTAVAYTAVEKRGLREHIAALLREKIFAGDLEPGDRIVESSVAKQMRVGQNSVREALQTLEHQGLITKIPNVGSFVTRLSESEVNDIYRVRAELEGLAVELAVEKCGADWLDRLETLTDEMESAANKSDWIGFKQADLRFHELIWESTGNGFLQQALAKLTYPLFEYLAMVYVKRAPLESSGAIEFHRTIVAKMREGSEGLQGFTSKRILRLGVGVAEDLRKYKKSV